MLKGSLASRAVIKPTLASWCVRQLLHLPHAASMGEIYALAFLVCSEFGNLVQMHWMTSGMDCKLILPWHGQPEVSALSA